MNPGLFFLLHRFSSCIGKHRKFPAVLQKGTIDMNKSREEEIMEMIRQVRAEEHMPEKQIGNDSDYDARQDILDWIESQGIYIRE